jgi:hypothetical protein
LKNENAQKWQVLEDLAIMDENDTDAYKMVQHDKGRAEVQKRK